MKSKFEFEQFTYRVRSNNCLAQCEVKFIPRQYDLVVIVKELPDNPGMSICNAFEDLFPQVVSAARLPLDSIKWVEYWPACSDREEDEYCQVHYELSYGKATRPSWRYLGHTEGTALEAVK